MKRFCFYFLLATFCCPVFASRHNAKPVVAVEERFELNSIVWRLEGAMEYSQCNVPTYASDIDSYFAPYREHPLIKYCDKLRENSAVAFDAVSKASGLIAIKGGRVYVVSDTAAAYLAKCDRRWTAESFTEYVRLMDDFYRTSDFHKFFKQHRGLYKAAETAFQQNVMSLDLAWFADFWGEEINSYTVFLSLTNGPSNYGNIPVAGSDNAVLVGCCYSNDSSVVNYNPHVIEILVHELMHKVANPVAAKYEASFAAALDKIYPAVAGRLSSAAYDRNAIMPEWFTRLGTLCFLKDCNIGVEFVDRSIAADHAQGFIWQEKAYQFMLDSFYTDRNRYRRFEDFVPQLSAFIDEFAADTANYPMPPYVLDAAFNVDEEISLSATDTLKITFLFSEDMASDKFGVELASDNDDALIENLENCGYAYSWVDGRTFLAAVPVECLTELGEFTVRLHLRDFVSQRGVHGSGFAQVTLPVVE